MYSLLVKDESATGEVLNEVHLTFKEESVSLQKIITMRVQQEVEVYNKKLPSIFHGLIQPSEAERTLNGYKMKKKVKVDAEKQVLTALAAFKANGFFVLVDDHQAEELNEMVTVKPSTVVSFVKLTPLVGG